MKLIRNLLLACAMGALVLACNEEDKATVDAGATADRGVTSEAGGDAGDDASGPPPSYCNPIADDWCLLPWPSSFYLKKDSTTATGFRVNYPLGAMPRSEDRVLAGGVTDKGKVLKTERFNRCDGFPISSQIVVYLKRGFAKAGLPDLSQTALSVSDNSPIWLMELKTAKRVPLFAELDANATSDEVAGLLIHPLEPLAWDTDYVVVLRNTLNGKDGKPLTAPTPFAKVLAGETIADPTLATEATRLKPVLDFLDKQTIARSSVVLAWDFHTASQQGVQGNVVSMVAEALKKLPAVGPTVSEIKTLDLTAKQSSYTLREVDGNVAVPSYLASDKPDSWLNLDKDGKPTYRAMQKFPFYLHIPRCAEKATGPLPVLYFGHGLFAKYRDELRSGWFRKLQNRLCMVTVDTSWIGLAFEDLANITNQIVGDDFSNMPLITDRLQQSHVNAQVVVEMMRGDFLKNSAMLINGKPVTDGKTIYYLGISDGGIQGAAFSALSRHIHKFMFNVSGGPWSVMIQRSSNFALLGYMLSTRYIHAADRLAMFSMSQHLWDFTDPISWAGSIVSKPLAGMPTDKQLILSEARYDDQVPNMATRIKARALGVPQMSPVVESVYGLTAKTGPLSSAYVQYGTNPRVKPLGTNTPAPKPDANDSAHEAVRRLEAFAKQLEAFYKKGGQAVHTCNGVCDPE